jgi:hypothetical protein
MLLISVSLVASDSSLQKALTGQTAASQFKTIPTLSVDFDPNEPPPNLTRRRGSKSLPSSPLSSPNTSPRMNRKNGTSLQNRYFTAAFPQPKPDSNQGYSGWLLAGLLGPRLVAVQFLLCGADYEMNFIIFI